MAETLTLSYTIGGTTFTRSRTVPDGSAVKILDATKERLDLAPATNQQVFDALADELFGALRQNVVNWRRQQAAETAAAAEPDIPLT